MKGYVRIWAEDDACPPDGRESLIYAYRRLTGKATAEYSRDAVAHEDQGDCDLYTLPNGIRVVSSFPGASAIWAPEHYRFVFGSNTEGRHGKGAALTAKDFFKAERGRSFGFQGLSYAIPTRFARQPRGKIDSTLELPTIKRYVDLFLVDALLYGSWYFDVTRLGCGNAGYRDDQIAPLFAGAPDNVHLPKEWR